jgi:CubicO group peptidase (beta-lactamase class C family)
MFERGKFVLDAPIATYAPEFADVRVYAGLDANGQPKYEAPRRPITVRDILRHTAGFTGGDGEPAAVTAIYKEIDPRNIHNTLPQFAAKLGQVPLAYQPGTQWRYSDAVDVQAYLVQKLSGVPFDEYLKLHIFRPLGMTSTRFTILPATRTARSSRRSTRATTMGRSPASPMKRRTPSTARTGRSSPAASAWYRRSTTT